MKDENEERFHRVFSVGVAQIPADVMEEAREVYKKVDAEGMFLAEHIIAQVLQEKWHEGCSAMYRWINSQLEHYATKAADSGGDIEIHEQCIRIHKNGVIEGLRMAAEIADKVETKYFILDTVILRIHNRADELEVK